MQRNLQWIHPLYLDLPVLILLLLMNPLMQTINCSKIRMVKCLPGILVLTAGMDLLWRRSGYLSSALRIFLWMSSWHHQGRRQTPDTYRYRTHLSHPNANVLQEIILRLMNMSVFLQTAMFIKLRTFLLIHMSTIHLLQGYLLGLQSWSSQMLHLDSLLRSHPWRCAC